MEADKECVFRARFPYNLNTASQNDIAWQARGIAVVDLLFLRRAQTEGYINSLLADQLSLCQRQGAELW